MSEEMLGLWIYLLSIIGHLMLRRGGEVEVNESREKEEDEGEGEIRTQSLYLHRVLNLCGEMSKHSSDRWLSRVLSLLHRAPLEAN
jgi:hypothetical protein